MHRFNIDLKATDWPLTKHRQESPIGPAHPLGEPLVPNLGDFSEQKIMSWLTVTECNTYKNIDEHKTNILLDLVIQDGKVELKIEHYNKTIDTKDKGHASYYTEIIKLP